MRAESGLTGAGAATTYVDVLCVGGGGAGLAAAVAAAEQGARVLVLEKRHTLGGNSRAATGIFGVESPVQERLNIVTSRDAAFRDATTYAHWQINARLLRAYIDRSGDTIRWLEDLGVSFPWVAPLAADQMPPTWHVAAGGGSAVVDALVARAGSTGVELRVRAGVQGLAQHPDGGFVATLGQESGVVHARCVVLATGGFGGAADLLSQHCRGFDPDAWFCMGLRHSGDGIRIGRRLGVAPDGLGLCEFEAPAVQGPLFLSLALREPAGLIVDREGRRYFDEGMVDNCFEAANALLRQPGQTAFGLLDARLREHVLRKAANKALGPLYEDQVRDPAQFERLLDGLTGRRGGVAATLADAAAIMGAEPDVLESTVAEYNRFCAQGYDEAFGKERRYLVALEEPPFYVLRGTVGFLNTIGGLRVTERLEAVDAGGTPIAGLYVAGVDAGGWQGDTYCFRLAGSSLGFAYGSGRIAGEQAAARARDDPAALEPTLPRAAR